MITPGGNPVCPECGETYGPGASRACPHESLTASGRLKSEALKVGPGAAMITRLDGVVVGVEVWPDTEQPGLYTAVIDREAIRGA